MTNTSTILICLFVSFGGFLFGYDTGLISGILEMRAFKDDFGPGNGAAIASHIKSLLVSILSVGTFVGSLVAGMLADRFGRRIAIIQSAAVFIAGVCLQTAGHNLGLMLPGRLIAGMGVGLLSGLIPLYQAEAAPKHLRGTLVSTYQLAITIGILAAFGVNQGTQNIDGRASYRTPIGLQLVFASVLLVGMIFLPESPRNLLRQDKRDQALRALSRLRGRPPHDPVIVDEMQELESNLALEAQIGEAQSYADCFRGNAARRTHIAVWIQMFQQLTGVNFVFYYGTTFFKQAGIKEAYLTSTITGVVNVVSTIPALWWVEKMGRRKLLILGSMIMFVAQLVVGVVGTARAPTLDPVSGEPVGNVDSNAGIVMIVFECLFIFGFASSWGPAAWVVSSEIFPLRLRSKGIALATASNWFWNWALGFSTPYLVDVQEANLGAKIAFLWAAFILAGGVFVYIFVPETKGLALEDVDEMFTSGISARDSSHYIVKDKHNPNPNANRLAGAKSDATLEEAPRV